MAFVLILYFILGRWYKANFAMSTFSAWGYHVGCAWFKSKCIAEGDSADAAASHEYYFCKSLSSRCALYQDCIAEPALHFLDYADYLNGPC